MTITGQDVLLVAVVGNFLLQLSWFIWSYSVSKRKHYTDEHEIEFIDKLDAYFSTKLENEKAQFGWNDFHNKEETGAKRDLNGKYKHEEIDGDFDSFFGKDA